MLRDATRIYGEHAISVATRTTNPRGLLVLKNPHKLDWNVGWRNRFVARGVSGLFRSIAHKP